MTRWTGRKCIKRSSIAHFPSHQTTPKKRRTSIPSIMSTGLISFLTCGLVQPKRKYTGKLTAPTMQQHTVHSSQFVRSSHQYAEPSTTAKVMKQSCRQPAYLSAEFIFPMPPARYVDKATSPASSCTSIKPSAVQAVTQARLKAVRSSGTPIQYVNKATSPATSRASIHASAPSAFSTKSSTSSVTHVSTLDTKGLSLSAAASVASCKALASTVRSHASNPAATESLGRSTISAQSCREKLYSSPEQPLARVSCR
ncbi:hypothetical protein BCR37DRAFT_16945 [Protomyces lactucae-debilis]|uniref:Uncharacterized protein n=1 Tax=Protomyces lactucae-debilis TaxID=2754530 RepID=A0A1Y2FXM3_PROLT|nr:uncharacterized protein BCR37DRAFT_16945 [Protomyces lactucae-debilis]ORY87926.1 hypothetical protein BCR37DRAFT_16945 [Protomyces lactucae-debilis]